MTQVAAAALSRGGTTVHSGVETERICRVEWVEDYDRLKFAIVGAFQPSFVQGWLWLVAVCL